MHTITYLHVIIQVFLSQSSGASSGSEIFQFCTKTDKTYIRKVMPDPFDLAAIVFFFSNWWQMLSHHGRELSSYGVARGSITGFPNMS